MDKREGEVSSFPSNFLCLTVPKNAVGEPSGFSGYRKSLDARMGGECQDFPSKNSSLTVPKKFVGQAVRVSLISAIETFCASEGYVTIFRGNFFVSHYRNISQRPPSMLCYRKILVAKKFMDKREGEISRHLSKISCLTLPKIFVGEPFSVS